MNTSSSSNHITKNLTLFLLGALVATSVLLVLYFTLPLGETENQISQSTEIPPKTNQTVNDIPVSPTNGIYTDNSITEIFTNYSSSFDRWAAFYSLVSRSDEETIVELFDEIQNSPFSEKYSEYFYGFRQAILAKLVVLNLNVANSLYEKLDTDLQYSSAYSFAREWANKDLNSVVDFVNKQPDSIKDIASRGVLDAMSELTTEELMELADRLGNSQYGRTLADRDIMTQEAENPKEAWENLLKDKSLLTEENFERVSNIVDAWVKQEGIDVLDIVTPNIEDEELRDRIISSGIRTKAEDDPASVFDYAMQFQSEDSGFFGMSMSYNRHMNRVLRVWIEQEPMDAVNRILEVESATQKTSLLTDAFDQWARIDAQTLTAAIPSFPPEARDIARVNAIRRIAGESIEDAVDLFEDIENDTHKTQAVFSISTKWTEEDPEAALAWAQTSSHTESIRPQLTAQIINTLAREDPQKAFDIAREMPIDEIGGNGVGLEASVISSLAYTNIDKALELLPDVREGKTQTTAYMGIGSGLAMNGRVAEAIELGKTLSEEDQLSYYTSVGTMSLTGGLLGGLTGSEAQESDVFETIDSIPHKGAQSKVAMQAIVMDKLNSSYSEEELERLQNYVSEEDREDLEKSLEQLDAMPPIPFIGF